MRLTRSRMRRKGSTLIEMMIAIPVGAMALLLIFTVIWGGTRLVTRNLATNLTHVNVITPMQRLSDDMHMAIASPQLTGTLPSGALGSVPAGYTSGGTKAWSRGKMTSWTSPVVVTGSGPAAGIQLYLMAGAAYTTGSGYTDPFGSYSATKAGYPVATGTYTASANSISIELQTSVDQTLFTSATSGMHLCIPSAPVLISGSNYKMVDCKITGVSFSGSPIGSGTASTLVATCTLSGTLGSAITTYGTRSNSSTAAVLAYLVAPVNYFVCGTDLIRLNYDGNWEIVMRNVLPTNNTWAIAQPFSMPWPYTNSFLSNTADGQRAVSVRVTASNPDYTTGVTMSSSTTNVNMTNYINSRYRGANADMVLYDLVLWSRMPLFDEMAR